MRSIKKIASYTLGLGIALSVIPEKVFACPVCYGDPDSNIVGSVFAGMITLLGMLGVIFGGLGVFFYKMNEREKLNTNINSR